MSGLLVLVIGLSLAFIPVVTLPVTAGSGTASPEGARLGSLMIDSDASRAVLTLVFCLGAVIFYFLLYRSRIVPRWIALWGLLAIPVDAAADVLALYSVIDIDSATHDLMFVPLFAQEMVLAAWMIARGFCPAAPSTGREEHRRPGSRDRSSAVPSVARGRHARRAVLALSAASVELGPRTHGRERSAAAPPRYCRPGSLSFTQVPAA